MTQRCFNGKTDFLSLDRIPEFMIRRINLEVATEVDRSYANDNSHRKNIELTPQQ